MENTNSKLFYQYYDTLFSKKDYFLETQICFKLAQKYGLGKPKKVLEIGCGTGNHTLVLAREKIALTAIDIDPEMVKIAKEKIKKAGINNVKILHKKIEDIKNNQFDLVVALFNVITYVPTQEELESFIKGVERNLAPGGVFIFDCWNGVAAILDPPKHKVTKIKQNGKEIKFEVYPVTNFFNQETILNYQIIVREKKATFKGRYSFSQTLWTPMQMLSSARKTGLENTLISSYLNLEKKATEKDWKIMFVFRKPK